MPSADLVLLAILPAVIWMLLAYVALSTLKSASKLREAWSAKTKRELVAGAQSWAMCVFLAFMVVLIGVVAWIRIQRSDALETILSPSTWERNIFHGILIGFSLVGMVLIFRRYFPAAKKFRLLVMAGIESPPWVRVPVLLLVVFTEELWRAVCLKELMVDGVSGPYSLVAASIAYGSTYLAWGIAFAISEGIVGAALGGLFLWSGSFFVPLAAHIVLGAQLLMYAVAAGPDAEAVDIHRRPHTTKCPACGGILSLRQVNLNPSEAFFCPWCHSRLTISDRRRGFVRWGFVFVVITLMVAFWDVFPSALSGNSAMFWVSFAATLCAGIGLGSILQVVFPPKLECGDPDFVGLNLGDRDPARPSTEKAKELDEPDSK